MKNKRYLVCMAASVLVAATTWCLSDSSANMPGRRTEYPTVADLTADNVGIRGPAVLKYVKAQKDLAEELGRIVHPNTGKRLSKAQRGSACFLMATMRTPNPKAIAALVAAVDEDFLPPLMSDIPYGILSPADALIRIGKPAVGPVLDELAKAKGEMRIQLLRTVLENVEGIDGALSQVKRRIELEKDTAAKVKLAQTLKYLELRKAEQSSRR